MDVEIFSLTGKNSADLSQTSGEIAKKLEQNGFSVTKVKSVSPSYSKIISALNELAKSEKAPDQVVIAEALTTKDSTSFRKKFAEVVAASFIILSLPFISRIFVSDAGMPTHSVLTSQPYSP